MNQLFKTKRRPSSRLQSYPEGRWLRVAIGDKGDSLDWKPGFEVLGDIRYSLGLLEEFGKEKAALPAQLAGLPCFAGLAACPFPPLYHECDFDDVTFMKHEESLGWRECRQPGFSSAEVRVYVWSSRRKELLSQARVLAARLETTLEELERNKVARSPQKKSRRHTPAVVQPVLRQSV
ncbi:MAG: hypothetical protein NTV93_20520 [Verrucomicrobia bacterium]|nr:hypothetical protein [Verrucomicrobiota bacterium]